MVLSNVTNIDRTKILRRFSYSEMTDIFQLPTAPRGLPDVTKRKYKCWLSMCTVRKRKCVIVVRLCVVCMLCLHLR